MSSTSQQFKLNIRNNSSNSGTVMLFQKNPDITAVMFPIAWLTKYTHPGSSATITWTLDYCFAWVEETILSNGSICIASQILPAQLNEQNLVDLTFDNQAYKFVNQRSSELLGSLQISEDNTIPLKQAMVGIGMSGSPVFMIQAQPNMNLSFTPKPEYWIAFGNFEKGQILDAETISNAAKIEFLPGVFTMNATQNADNSWTLEA